MSILKNPTVWKVIGVALVAGTVFFCYSYGSRHQSKVQKNMLNRLELTRQRHQGCITQVKMLKGEMQGKIETELQLAEQEHSALLTENELLQEDNEILREENYSLEEQIDELRDELDDLDWVSDDDVGDLQNVMDLGNNTEGLREVLQDVTYLGGINKDTLIDKLLGEAKVKRTALKNCKINLKRQQSVLVNLEAQVSGKPVPATTKSSPATGTAQ
eukprot:NODE_3632_length_869_cov_65.688679_g3610_i0.p1 GENE.NODE_3632_length_869_cov_65.688679_g3610_i0~~NODE_3632_length_869_cov_65.688679_g3610_i0.p1  ORF type:complete len:216 (+),score=66.53 NODE_3632_length_869_cov_65.688679_g3610_i0:82-729(+)